MQATARKTTVCIDTRRVVSMLAAARKPREVAQVPHEAFIRNTLKDKMGWPRREPAPEAIKEVARQMAAQLRARDKGVAEAKAAAKAATEALDARWGL